MAFLDLVREGNIGLTIAVERFDPYRGYRFRHYWWIRQAISRDSTAGSHHQVAGQCPGAAEQGAVLVDGL